MKSKKNVINALCGEVTTITTRLNKLNKFISKEFYNIDNIEREQILKEKDIQINYLSILIQRIAHETELFLKDINEGPKHIDGEKAVKPRKNTTDNRNKWVIYRDDPKFEDNRVYLKKIIHCGIIFTCEIKSAKKYDNYPEALKDMDMLKIIYGVESYIYLLKEYEEINNGNK